MSNVGSFELSIIYRLAVECARTWVISHWLEDHTLPKPGCVFVYPRLYEASMDWGDAAGEPDEMRPLKDKRVRVSLTIEDANGSVIDPKDEEIDRLRAAIGKAVRGIRAEMVDRTQGTSETIGKIDMRIDELSGALQPR